ncbi:MAG: hypothetical protein EBQ96_08390 [Proteobacteria bacterium]|nr:hypothetical protein [Pseudomonadota bacterium]
MIRKSTVGAGLLSVMLVLQGCAGTGTGQEMRQTHTHTRTAANDDAIARCEAESDAPEECAEHADIERELRALKARQPRNVVR